MKKINVLLIGSGGREHALARYISQSPSLDQLFCYPGSSAIKEFAKVYTEIDSPTDFCKNNNIQLVVIGPEEPLVNGMADTLRNSGVLVVGPSKAAAQLEGSKVFSKQFMMEAGVPTSPFHVVSSVAEALEAAHSFQKPYVLKADGLAAGKGVYICQSLEELKKAAHELFEKKVFGTAGQVAVLEGFLPGWELSFLVTTNGHDFSALPIAQDHKRLKDHDQGPNTGGMGAVAPFEIDSDLKLKIENTIVKPSLKLMEQKGYLYHGVLYFGIMVTNQGPHLLEFNCRFGDPETQVILPLIQNDPIELFTNLASGKVDQLIFKNVYTSCLVLAAPGYPMSPQKGIYIDGEIEFKTENSYFIHSGTNFHPERGWVTHGGRVICAIGIGESKQKSLEHANKQASQVHWEGLQKRSDIGFNWK